MKRANTTLLYGETGTGKTTQLGELAKWYYNLTGKVARLISADSNWDPIEEYIITKENPLAFIEAWNIQFLAKDPAGKNDPFGILVKLSEGYWPKFRDGKIVLEAPTLPNSLGHMCPIRADGREIGMILLEGLATISDLLLQDHIRCQRKIAQDVVGDFTSKVEVEKGGKLVVEETKFGKAAMAHFGHVQEFVLLDLVPRFAAMAVDFVVWTGHEAKGVDDITKIKGSQLGPATVGTATVGRTAKKFGDTFHLQNELDRSIGPMVQHRAYYRDHPDPLLDKMTWPCKVSFPLHRSEELAKAFPGGFVPLTVKSGLDAYWDLKYKDVKEHWRKKDGK